VLVSHCHCTVKNRTRMTLTASVSWRILACVWSSKRRFKQHVSRYIFQFSRRGCTHSLS